MTKPENSGTRKTINYSLVRSRRKTVGIYITKDAGVEVRAPLKIKKADIDKIVAAKEKWIMKHLAAREARNERKAEFSLDYGSVVLLRGREYPIKAKAGNMVGFDDNCFYMPENLGGTQIRHAVVQIYKLTAKNILPEKTAYFSKIMGVVPANVKINSAKTRWGSCSGKNSLNFSWRLILANDDVIDYVVVHELAHIKEHNHSDRFWKIVGDVLPDYETRQQGLKVLLNRLANENWDNF